MEMVTTTSAQKMSDEIRLVTPHCMNITCYQYIMLCCMVNQLQLVSVSSIMDPPAWCLPKHPRFNIHRHHIVYPGSTLIFQISREQFHSLVERGNPVPS